MFNEIELGKTYLKRSGLTGKTRSMVAVHVHGERVTCIADDNGREVIVNRVRLWPESKVLVSEDSLEKNPRIRELVLAFCRGK